MAAATTCCRARCDLIHDGFLDFTIDQQPYLQGFYTVMEMFTFLASGGLVRTGRHQHRPEVRHQGQVDPYLTTSTRYEGKTHESRRSCRAQVRSRADVFRDGCQKPAAPEALVDALGRSSESQHPCGGAAS